MPDRHQGETSATRLLKAIHHDVNDVAMRIGELTVLATRLERYQHEMMRVLRRTEREVLVAYEAELAAAEAEAAANDDAEASAEGVLKVLTDLVATLKTAQTDPATAQRITDLTAAMKKTRDKLAAAIAATPTE